MLAFKKWFLNKCSWIYLFFVWQDEGIDYVDAWGQQLYWSLVGYCLIMKSFF